MTTTTDDTRSRIAEELGRDRLLELLSDMMMIRRFEERSAAGYQQAKIGGFCHLYNGQEAVAVGSVAALKDDDPLITAYRDHGHALARGMDPKYAMAELYGKITGCSKGKGGSMHLFDRDNHMYGGHAIVGGHLPLGVGLAFSIQYQEKDNVCICYFGDGALNQGAFHEAANLAGLWNLPILFVVENNQYAMGTHIARGTTAADDLSVKAKAYEMRYAECDGMDFFDVYECFKREADLSRPSGENAGPVFVNAKTYRYQGHSMSDPQKYRSKEEVAEHQEVDPINTLVNFLIEADLADQDTIDEMDKSAKQTAKDAVKFAEESDDTPASELYTDVYSEPYGPYEKGDLPEMCRPDDSA
ncbi:MAG: pyruvate dehydrogenase (acetyl-transferring) E1 component subunit alpha [Phycisphaeraceae bacterium]|nr:pyruvate dehydrogenase (acetyl-transferring) E1 component subunit alpha [Phycisphaeraceae bacterium]